MGVKRISFNSNKTADDAAEAAALFIDLMLICVLEVRRSIGVLTGIGTNSAFMENLHGRRREMIDMTETNLGDIVQNFHWMMRTDLRVS